MVEVRLSEGCPLQFLDGSQHVVRNLILDVPDQFSLS